MRLACLPVLLGCMVLLGGMPLAATSVAAHAATPAQAQSPEMPTVQADIVEYEFRLKWDKAGRVRAGTTVVFTNRGEHPHTVTDRGGTFDELVMPGQTASIYVEIPGRVTFFCKVSASKPGTPNPMDGTLNVRPAYPPAVTRIQASDPARFGTEPSFDPDELTVDAGSSVQVANIGGQQHSLTADDGSFDTGVIEPGGEGGRFAGKSAVFVAEEPGTYPFHCRIHPERMRGVLTVRETAPEPAPSAAPDGAAAQATPSAAPGGGPPGAADPVAAGEVSAGSALSGRAWLFAGLAGLAGLVIGIGIAVAILLGRGGRTSPFWR